MIIHRRGMLTGLGALICAPAIVRASSLMPVKAFSTWDASDITYTATEGGPIEYFIVYDKRGFGRWGGWGHPITPEEGTVLVSVDNSGTWSFR